MLNSGRKYQIGGFHPVLDNEYPVALDYRHGKTMLVRGRLVLKLPAPRVDALVAAGDGVRFDANKGTPMREWFSLDPESGLAWLPLAREALDFAQAGR